MSFDDIVKAVFGALIGLLYALTTWSLKTTLANKEAIVRMNTQLEERPTKESMRDAIKHVLDEKEVAWSNQRQVEIRKAVDEAFDRRDREWDKRRDDWEKRKSLEIRQEVRDEILEMAPLLARELDKIQKGEKPNNRKHGD